MHDRGNDRPLIGGKIADWVGKNDAQRTLDAEFASNDRRLGAAG